MVLVHNTALETLQLLAGQFQKYCLLKGGKLLQQGMWDAENTHHLVYHTAVEVHNIREMLSSH